MKKFLVEIRQRQSTIRWFEKVIEAADETEATDIAAAVQDPEKEGWAQVGTAESVDALTIENVQEVE